MYVLYIGFRIDNNVMFNLAAPYRQVILTVITKTLINSASQVF